MKSRHDGAPELFPGNEGHRAKQPALQVPVAADAVPEMLHASFEGLRLISEFRIGTWIAEIDDVTAVVQIQFVREPLLRIHNRPAHRIIRTAGVFGRTSPLASDTARIFETRFGRQRLLDVDGVPPRITHVVLIAELVDALLDQLAQLHLALVADLRFREIVLPLFGKAETLVADLELVKVVILPAQDHLDDVMQFRQCAILGLHPAPNRRPSSRSRQRSVAGSEQMKMRSGGHSTTRSLPPVMKESWPSS